MIDEKRSSVDIVQPGAFEAENHYYPRVLNAQIHPTVAHFLNLSTARLVARYCHMNPRVMPARLHELLSTTPRHFRWSGADLFHVATAGGNRQMVVIETNSCPSGQKSMPWYQETQEEAGYRALLEHAFIPLLNSRRLPAGGLAVLYDKNLMENSGYAATLAGCTGEPVYLTPLFVDDPDPPARFSDGILEVRTPAGEWTPIRAAFRYVTQRPWNRIPLSSRTLIFNSPLTCLAGGRNKMLAAKAYDMFNRELLGSGLAIRTPETIWDVHHHEVPLWVRSFGGLAVIKVPYANAGVGVFTITSEQELEAFMEQQQRYQLFIVQSLIGNHSWTSHGRSGRLYHVGTVPNKRVESYVADLRVMVCAGPQGFRPLVIYARRGRRPLVEQLSSATDSWAMLGTNLSVRRPDGGWETQTERLVLMDQRDFNRLGIGIDELIEAYVQTVLATVAIDKLAETLTTRKGKFRMKLFGSMNNDPSLIEEITL